MECSKDTIQKMMATMLRRGPDENGYFHFVLSAGQWTVTNMEG